MRRTILTLTLPALLVTGASHATAGGLDVRIGGWFPQSQSCAAGDESSGRACFFTDLENLYTPNGDANVGVKPKDFNGLSGGIEYNTTLMPNVELGLHFDASSGDVDTSYRDYTRPDDSEIQQTLRLSTMPLGATIRLVPTSKRTRFAPYIGAGVDAVFYKYEEMGDLIDWADPDLAIYNDHFKDTGVAFGVHGVAGARFYVNDDFAVVAEGRYLFARKDLGGDFAPDTNVSGLRNRIDLSGFGVLVGLHVRF